MTIRHVEIFVKVAECGKMNEVARDLYISQSSVSQAIAEIENEYQVRLFERLSRKLYLTPVGQGFLAYAKRFLTLYGSMCQFLEETGEIRDIRIGATITVGTCVIGAILHDIQKKYADFNAQIFVANTHLLEEKLIDNELDIALVEGHVTHPMLMVTHAIPDQLVLICGVGHPFWGRREISVQELEHQNFIMREQGSGTRAQLEEKLIADHIHYCVKWTCYNTEAIKNAVIANEGISVLSLRLIQQEVGKKQLWVCKLKDFPGQRNFNIIYHKDKLMFPVLREFIAACQRFGEPELKI